MKQDTCCICFQNIEQGLTIADWIAQDSCICGNCKKEFVRLQKQTTWQHIPIHIEYLYNDFLENLLYQFKESRDIALKEVFFYDCIKKINDKYRHYQIVIMPSSYEKIEERNFHHMLEMLNKCKLPIMDPFEKISNHKQSLQSFEERQNIGTYIRIKPNAKLLEKPILLVDDVITTGATIKYAYQQLIKHTTKIEAFILCANPLFVELCDEK